MFPHLSATKEQQRTVICFLKESKEPSYVSTFPQRKLTTQRSVKWSQNAFAQFLLKRVTFPLLLLTSQKIQLHFFCIQNTVAFETMCSLDISCFLLYLHLPDQSCDQCCDLVSRINHCLEMFFAVSENSISHQLLFDD